MSQIIKESSGGIKGDGGKRMWELIDYEFLDRIVDVVTFGAKKYEANNWKKVSRYRYESALQRHLSSYLQLEKKDNETGITHLAHIATSAMFLNWFDKEEDRELNECECTFLSYGECKHANMCTKAKDNLRKNCCNNSTCID